jgi:hypothetical protein
VEGAEEAGHRGGGLTAWKGSQGRNHATAKLVLQLLKLALVVAAAGSSTCGSHPGCLRLVNQNTMHQLYLMQCMHLVSSCPTSARDRLEEGSMRCACCQQ